VPLYWTPAELQALNVSPVFAKAMTGWRMAAKQYVYLVHLLRSAPAGLGLPPSCGATVLPFDVYRWAFAATITRQNRVPFVRGQQQGDTLALVPVWDMCNHEEGACTTSFDPEKGLECHATADVAAGGSINIFYGPRPNSEFFLYQGFVMSKNSYDYFVLPLRLVKIDPLLKMKTLLLRNLAIEFQEAPSGDIIVRAVLRAGQHDKALRGVLRIAVIDTKEAAATLLRSLPPPPAVAADDYEVPETPVLSTENEEAAAAYLRNICKEQCDTLTERLEELVAEEDPSYHDRLAVGLLTEELRLFEVGLGW